jgi:branched-subunit amino acid transport protein
VYLVILAFISMKYINRRVYFLIKSYVHMALVENSDSKAIEFVGFEVLTAMTIKNNISRM